MVFGIYFNSPSLYKCIPKFISGAQLKHGVISVSELRDVSLASCDQLIELGYLFLKVHGHLRRKPIKFNCKD